MKANYFSFSEAVYHLAKRTHISNPEDVIYEASITCDPVVTIRIAYGDEIGLGHAICGPMDEFNEVVGLNIALARAMRDVAEKNRRRYNY